MTNPERCSSTTPTKQTRRVRHSDKEPLDASSSPHPAQMDAATRCRALPWDCVQHFRGHIQLSRCCRFENSNWLYGAVCTLDLLHHLVGLFCFFSMYEDKRPMKQSSHCWRVARRNEVVMRTEHTSCWRENTCMSIHMTCRVWVDTPDGAV